MGGGKGCGDIIGSWPLCLSLPSATFPSRRLKLVPLSLWGEKDEDTVTSINHQAVDGVVDVSTGQRFPASLFISFPNIIFLSVSQNGVPLSMRRQAMSGGQRAVCGRSI